MYSTISLLPDTLAFSYPRVLIQSFATNDSLPAIAVVLLDSRSAISEPHAAFHGRFPDFARCLLNRQCPFATCLARALPHGTRRRRKGQRCFSQALLRFPPLRSRQNPCVLRFARRKTKGANRRYPRRSIMSELKGKAIKAAAKSLEQRGYEIVESNWKSENSSLLDLVAKETTP